jgi:hypothetical protein
MRLLRVAVLEMNAGEAENVDEVGVTWSVLPRTTSYRSLHDEGSLAVKPLGMPFELHALAEGQGEVET